MSSQKKIRSFKQDLFILLSCFLVSRIIIKLVGISFGYNALDEYWQYLDITSLKTNLLQSLWWLHSQPPVFNFLLGIILKFGGESSLHVMAFFLLVISFGNATLLLSILRRVTFHDNLALFFSLLYLLSPATMLFENELFYTSFISLLLLSAVYFMVRFNERQSWKHVIGIFVSLTLVSLTRSMYHLVWLAILTIAFIILNYRKAYLKKIMLSGLLSISLVGGWYLKNYELFGNFSASSWVGINFARIVFHNNLIENPANIASVPPFMPISYYRSYISDDYKKKYAGVNDRNLLMETKNGRFINMNNAGYLEVSKKYLQAGIKEVKEHPTPYIRNAVTAFIIYFTPASGYFKVKDNDNRLSYYDLVYSLNLSHLFKEDLKKKQSLVISAIPKFLMYFFTLSVAFRNWFRTKSISFVNIFMIATILFSLTVSTLLDYGENMRFRYEIEPLFLVLSAQVIMSLFRTDEKIMNGQINHSTGNKNS